MFGLAAARPAAAQTLGEVLRSRGLSPPATAVPRLDRALAAHQIVEDERELLVVYALVAGGTAPLRATRFQRDTGRWSTRILRERRPGSGRPPPAIDLGFCRSGFGVERYPGGYLVRAHINPSAECTLVLDPDLSVRGVLAGWPVATLADGRIVYQRNQVHFAAVHPVGLALFDPRRPRDAPIYPPRPASAARSAHVARMRAVYTESWCAPRNHPCDPELFDERVAGEVAADERGDSLAFVIAWDNTAGWSDIERWGRLEAFRESRAALARWDGQGEPSPDAYRALAGDLARVRNMNGGASVTAALADDPLLAALVWAALSAPPAVDARAWLVGLDARWAAADTWRRLGRAVRVPDEVTEVVYVHTGLRDPAGPRYRELLRADFEARFGGGLPARALGPEILRELFAAPP